MQMSAFLARSESDSMPYEVYQHKQQAMQVRDISEIHKDSFERSTVCLMLVRIHSSIMICQKSK